MCRNGRYGPIWRILGHLESTGLLLVQYFLSERVKAEDNY